MTNLSNENSKIVLTNLLKAKKGLPKSSKAYKSVVRALHAVAPSISSHMHQMKLDQKMNQIIDKYFHGKVPKFAIWLDNVYYHDVLNAPKLNKAYAMLNDTFFTFSEKMPVLINKSEYDQFAQARVSRYFADTRNIVDQAEQYGANSYVAYDNSSLDHLFVRHINIHDVLSILKVIKQKGTLDFNETYHALVRKAKATNK